MYFSVIEKLVIPAAAEKSDQLHMSYRCRESIQHECKIGKVLFNRQSHIHGAAAGVAVTDRYANGLFVVANRPKLSATVNVNGRCGGNKYPAVQRPNQENLAFGP